jgi:hypothetical protein
LFSVLRLSSVYANRECHFDLPFSRVISTGEPAQYAGS